VLPMCIGPGALLTRCRLSGGRAWRVIGGLSCEEGAAKTNSGVGALTLERAVSGMEMWVLERRRRNRSVSSWSGSNLGGFGGGLRSSRRFFLDKVLAWSWRSRTGLQLAT
jgi:hypothetical protein